MRLSRLAWLGAVLVVAGVGLGLYGRIGQAPPWAARASIPLVALGALLYYVERYRSFRKRRKR